MARAKLDRLGWRRAAEQLAAAADPARVGIMLALEQGERTATILAAESGCSSAATLRHLGQLVDTGFLEATSAGKYVVYELTSAGRALVKTIRALERV